VGQLYTLPLRVGQRIETLGDLVAFFAKDCRVGNDVGGPISGGASVAEFALGCGLVCAHAVHRAPMGKRQQPGQRRPCCGIVVAGVAPHLQVNLLGGFLAEARIAQYTGHQPEDTGAR